MKKRKHDVEKNARIFLLFAGFALSLAAVGLFATTFFNQKSKIEDIHSWTKTNCVIESRELESEGKEYSSPDSAAKFHWKIIYSYYVDDKRYASDVLNAVDLGIYLGKGTFLDYIALTNRQIKDETGPYPKDSRQICYVNPNDPEDAVLELAEIDFKKICASLWEFKSTKMILEGCLFIFGLFIILQGAKVLLPDRYKPIKRD
jgi:hypothetical protein